MSSEGESGSGKKDVTVRGVDAALFNRAAEIAKRTGKTMGDVVSEALRLLIYLSDNLAAGMEPVADAVSRGLKGAESKVSYTFSSIAPAIVSDLEELEVSKEDMEQFGRRIVFQNVKRLVFRDDVDAKTFEKYVALIKDCEKVKPPKGVSKLLVLSRCRGVGKLETS